MNTQAQDGVGKRHSTNMMQPEDKEERRKGEIEVPSALGLAAEGALTLCIAKQQPQLCRGGVREGRTPHE